jgi:hypothetical protein
MYTGSGITITPIGYNKKFDGILNSIKSQDKSKYETESVSGLCHDHDDQDVKIWLRAVCCMRQCVLIPANKTAKISLFLPVILN